MALADLYRGGALLWRMPATAGRASDVAAIPSQAAREGCDYKCLP